MSDEKTTPDDVVDPVESAADADAQPVQPTGKRRRKGAPERPVVEVPAEQEKETKNGFFPRAGRVIAAFFVGIWNYLKSVYDQMRKVVWPTRKQMLMSVLAVFIFLVITVALVFGVDTGAGELVRVIFQNPDAGAGAGPVPGLPGM